MGVRAYGLVASAAKQFSELVQAYLDARRNVVLTELAALLEKHADHTHPLTVPPETAAHMLIEMAIAEPLRIAALGVGPRPGEQEIRLRVNAAVIVFLNEAGSIG